MVVCSSDSLKPENLSNFSDYTWHISLHHVSPSWNAFPLHFCIMLWLIVRGVINSLWTLPLCYHEDGKACGVLCIQRPPLRYRWRNLSRCRLANGCAADTNKAPGLFLLTPLSFSSSSQRWQEFAPPHALLLQEELVI